MFIWQGRKDAGVEKARIFEFISNLEAQELRDLHGNFCFTGFACDEGVKRNQGRVGAKEGPSLIRKALANLCIPAIAKEGNMQLYDVSDVVCADTDLESAQKKLAQTVGQILKANGKPIVLGGGHETAYGHFLGLVEYLNPNERIGIVNFDAHFDLRKTTPDGQGSSGTPFFQVNEYCQSNNICFDYTVFGLQPTANDFSLFETAKRFNVEFVTAQEMFENTNLAAKQIEKVVQRCDRIYLTLCLDVFQSAFAPGVSAPAALGLCPWQVSPLIKKVAQSKKLFGFDIVELNPRFDEDSRTAKLAAALTVQVIFNSY